MKNWFKKHRLQTGFALALAANFAVCAIAVQSTRLYVSDARWTEHTYQVLRAIALVREYIQEAQSERRGFGLSKDRLFADRFYAALARLENTLNDLRKLTADNPAQQGKLKELEPLISKRIQSMREHIRQTETNSVTPEEAAKITVAGYEASQKIVAVLNAMQEEEETLLGRRRASQALRGTVVYGVLAGGGLITLGVISILLLQLQRQVRIASRSEGIAHDASARLAEQIDELAERNRQITMIGGLNSLLQACRTQAECFDVVRQAIEEAFPACSGALSIIRPSRNAVTVSATWGGALHQRPEFDPAECWALRRGRPHLAGHTGANPACKHFTDTPPEISLCLPMIAHGETVGVLTLTLEDARLRLPVQSQLFETIADTVGMAIANMALRDKLMIQAITDPLTGLYNRRYMEESLMREVSRASRGEYHVGLILIDLDHFKKFNDVHGHQAGDEVLLALGAFLRSSVRTSDLACRFGGEEFALVLPGNSLENTRERAEQLRERATALTVHYRGQTLGGITLSIGVSGCPMHGTSMDGLIRAADDALYASKSGGRNRVTVAPVETPTETDQS